MNADNSSLTDQLFDSPDWTTQDIDSEPKKYPEYVQYTALTIGIPFAVFSITGNLLTIIVVLKTKSLWTGTNLFIISLSTFDLIYGCFVIPTSISVTWNNGWLLGDAYCRIYPLIQWLTIGEALISLSGIAVGRCLKIIYSATFSFIFGSKVNTSFLLCSFWSVPILILLPAITGLWGNTGYEPKTLTCTILRDDSNYTTFLLVSAYAIPIVLITFCYLRIMCRVYSNHRRVQAARQQIPAGSCGASAKQTQRQQREDLRYTKMMLSIFIVFLMAYAPYMINSRVDPDHTNMAIGFFTSSCAWFSPCLNPLIYVLLNRQFQNAFLALLPYQCRGNDVEEVSQFQSQNNNS